MQIHLGVGVAEIGPGHVRLADGTELKTRTVVWGGGEMAAPLLAAAGLAQGRGGRIDVSPDLTVPGAAGVYVLGDAANIAGPDGKPFPSSARSPSSPAAGRPRTSRPTSPASRASRSTTTTKGSWR